MQKPVVSSPFTKDILKEVFIGLVVKEIMPKSIAEKFFVLIENEKRVAKIGKMQENWSLKSLTGNKS